MSVPDRLTESRRPVTLGLVPEAPLPPGDRDAPAADGGVPDVTGGGSDPLTPVAELRHFARFAFGLSRQHGWRVVTARLVLFAIALGILLFILAEFVKST
jgi:hypothetical protein